MRNVRRHAEATYCATKFAAPYAVPAAPASTSADSRSVVLVPNVTPWYSFAAWPAALSVVASGLTVEVALAVASSFGRLEAAVLWLEARHRRPGLDQRPGDREVVVQKHVGQDRS